MSINRRWDPVVWREEDGFRMLCLAADYSAEGNSQPWWMGDNQMELWSGNTLDTMELVRAWPRTGTVWTAPSVFRTASGDVFACVGLNDEGQTPRQRIHIADPYTMGHVARLPDPPGQYARGDRCAWRDACIIQSEGDWLLTVTTGGFRWSTPPQVLLYRSDDPISGRWWCDGPLLDPVIAMRFAELERPQLRRLFGRWVLLWSAWPERQFFSPGAAPVWLTVSLGDEPFFPRPPVNLNAPYGLHVVDGIAAGWHWIDRASYTSQCIWATEPETLTDLISRLESSSCQNLVGSPTPGASGA